MSPCASDLYGALAERPGMTIAQIAKHLGWTARDVRREVQRGIACKAIRRETSDRTGAWIYFARAFSVRDGGTYATLRPHVTGIEFSRHEFRRADPTEGSVLARLCAYAALLSPEFTGG